MLLVTFVTACALIGGGGNSDTSAATTTTTTMVGSAITKQVKPATPSGLEARGGSFGLAQDFMEDCSPIVGSDFVDEAPWHTSRLNPADCAVLRTNTPQFSWRQPGNFGTRSPWTFTLRRVGTGEVVKTVQTTVPRVFVSGPVLEAGAYEWDVSFKALDSMDVVRSNVRRFWVAASGVVRWPDGVALADQAAEKARPRLLPTGSSFKSILAAASTSNQRGAYLALIDTAIQAKNAPALNEPVFSRASIAAEAAYTASINALKNNLALERRRIEAMGLMWHFSGDITFAHVGRARLMTLAAWDPTGITSETNSDQSNREIYLTLAQGLDLYNSQLTPSQVASIVSVLKRRLEQVRANIKAVDTYPYNPHALNSLQYLLEALLFAVGSPGFEEANRWLADAYEMFLITANTFQTEDGGFGNGVTYGWHAMNRLPHTMAALRVIGGVDMTQHPAIGQFGNFFIAFTAPNGNHMSGFGDEGHVSDNYQRYAWEGFRLYAMLTRNSLYEWYWRFAPDNMTRHSYPGAWPLMILGLGIDSASTITPPSSDSWFFPDAGVAAIHSNTADPLRSSLYFRSSRFGSFNHSHADQNSFTLVSHGRSLLISGGYYPYYMSPHHATVNRATRYKNALTFDGGIGQAEPVVDPILPGKPVESMDARGRMINAFDDHDWVVVTGDATLAYRGYDAVKRSWTPLLDNALRSLAYSRSGKMVVIYDWATSNARERRWELNFNSVKPFAIESVTARISNGPASACIEIYGPPGTYTTTKGFEVAPETSSPDQYQLRYSVNTASNQFVAITLIREDCRSMPVRVQFNGTVTTVDIGGIAPLTFDRATVAVQ